MIYLKPEVIALGEPMVELCATGSGRLSEVDLFKRGWGGDTSNFAVAAARTGSRAAHLCRLGDDEFGRSFLELWKREGLDTGRVTVERGGVTAVYFISLMAEGRHDFTYFRAGSAASRYNLSDLDFDYLSGAKIFHTSGISLAVSEALREAALEAMIFCQEKGIHVTFDVNMRHKLWQPNTARGILQYAFELADTVFASYEEMKSLFPVIDPSDASYHIRERGTETAVIKLGGGGCHVTSGREEFHSAGYKVDVVDTTGSGDAFDGAWVTATLERWPLRERARFANAVGALTATGLGAVTPIPSRERAQNLMKEQGTRG